MTARGSNTAAPAIHEIKTLLIPQVEIPYTQYCSWTFVFAIAHLEEASARTSMNFQEVAD